jgi:hypothetical protein
MDEGTWNRLNSAQQAAVRGMSNRFIKAVQASGAFDGWDFSQKYSVQLSGSEFVITNGTTPLTGIRHSDPIVLEALMTDAIQNYGR